MTTMAKGSDSRHSPADRADLDCSRPGGTAVAHPWGWSGDALAAERSRRPGAGAWRRWCDFPRREQTRAEELGNTISHGIGLVAALVGIPFLVATVARQGDLLNTVGAIVFSATVVALYFSSTVYHGLQNGKAKRVFRVVEHSAIYVLIAGTYTPFALGVLRGPWGWTLLGAVWAFAAVGVTLKVCSKASHPVLSTGLYLLMGWLIVVAAEPLIAGLLTPVLLLLIAGGLSYTVGVIFFALDSRLHFGHLVWHAFVMAGTACHYFAVLLHAA
jgi:hemolysin III